MYVAGQRSGASYYPTSRPRSRKTQQTGTERFVTENAGALEVQEQVLGVTPMPISTTKPRTYANPLLIRGVE